MNEALIALVTFINNHNGINDKDRLAKLVCDRFALTKDRTVYYSNEFAVRFSASTGRNFGNTVLSLSNLRKYDDKPFVVCLVTPAENFLPFGEQYVP